MWQIENTVTDVLALDIDSRFLCNGRPCTCPLTAGFTSFRNRPKTAGKALTGVGRKRVEVLARLLMDAGIDVIYSSSISSGRRTAEPIEKALNIKSNLISPQLEVMDDLVRRLPTEHMGHRVIIVAGNTIRGHIAKAYGVKDIWKFRSDNLIVIVPRSGSEPIVIKMRW